jgi:DNA segregation ATPase FtsK/SpoIIIE-like protein
MALDFRRILDTNQSVIINLAVADAEARRLLGCLLTVAAEQGALSRSELPPGERHGRHVLIIDEFSEFTAQSEEALARMLSQTRKFGLYLVMAHQTWSQASSRLKGALQNVGLEVVFR